MQLPLGARHRGERMPRSADSEGCCGAGRATPGHAVVASGCRRRTAPRDRRARTVRSPQHRLRGEQLWEQACRGSADSCETRRTIGRALAKKHRPRRLLREPQLGRCSGKHTRRRTVRSPNAVAATGVRGLLVRGFVTGCGAAGRGRARPAGRGTALVRCLPVAARGRRPQCKARLDDPAAPAFHT